MKPALSSSGTYDGGEPIKKAINDSEFDQLVLLFNKARLRIYDHMQNRVMRSGKVYIKDENDQVTFILAPRSEILEKIENKLIKLKIIFE